MAHITTGTEADDVFAKWINRKFVSDLEYALQHQKFTLKGEIAKGAGANILRFVEFTPPTLGATGGVISYSGAGQASITEASTTANEITGIQTTPTEATIAEYGEFLKIGQLYEYAAVSGTRERLSKRLRDGGAASIDTTVRLWAQQTTNKVFATAAATGGVTTGPAAITALGASTLILARKTLFGGLAKGFDGIPGHPDGQYAAVLTPQQELDVVTEVTTSRVYWSGAVVNVPGKMGQEKFVNGYIGSVYGVATYVTQNYQTSTYTSAAQIGFVYADGGLGAASYGDMQPEIVINDVNSPYKNVNSIAWHAMFGGKLISSARVVMLYSTGA
jgi:hypothetical protein